MARVTRRTVERVLDELELGDEERDKLLRSFDEKRGRPGDGAVSQDTTPLASM